MRTGDQKNVTLSSEELREVVESIEEAYDAGGPDPQTAINTTDIATNTSGIAANALDIAALNLLQIQKTALTQSELDVLDSSPTVILPNPGVPYMVHDVVFTFSGTAYAGANVEVGELTTEVGTFSQLASLVIGAGAVVDRYYKMIRFSTTQVGGANDQGTTVSANSLQIYMQGGDPSGGGADSRLTVWVYWSYLDIP